MSINRLFLRIALLLITVSSISLAGIGNSKTKYYPANFFNGNKLQGLTTAKVYSIDKVVAVKFNSPYDGSQLYVYSGTFNGDVDGNTVKFYCIDISHELAYYTTDQPHTYTDSGNTSSKITYILNKYYPLNPFPYAGSLSAEEREAAAVQLAIWHFSDSVDVTTLLDNPDILTRAEQIIDDANLNAGNIVPVETLVVTPLNQVLQTGTTAGFYVTALDNNNNPISNVQITLTSSSGTLSTMTAVTGSDGKTPVISLIPGADSAAVITAVAKVTIPQGTRYVHTIQPDNFQKLVLATPVTSLKQTTSNISWMNLHLASVGDRVWFDVNRNGIQDSSESGASSVNVHLFDCSGILLASTLTDNNGIYHFDSLASGNYYVKFDLPAGYRFSPAKSGNNENLDSDADSTGRTECFALAVNEHQTKWDAGIYIPESPVVSLTKDDGRVFMADSGSTVTYSIHFANTGHLALHSVTIIDTLPSGLSYVSCTGAITCGQTGSSVVTFQIGNVDTAVAGQVTLTALVSGNRSDYLNVAYFAGTDIYGRTYTASASDLDLHDTTTSGGCGGVESNANMSELLLKRLLKIENGQTTRILPKTKPGNITASLTLQSMIPQSGPFNSTAVETTPFDILGISNAVSAYAADYIAPTEVGLRRVASIFSTITTAPNIYDHFKSVCDRLAGAQITSLDLVTINGKQFYSSKITRPGTTDYAISFCLYETSNGFSVENKWTYDEYVAPNNALNVYNFQVWSSSISSTISMVQNILSAASAVKPMTYMNNSQLSPVLYIKDAAYSQDGKIHMTLVNNYSTCQVSFKTLFRVSQGGDQSQTVQNITVNAGESSVVLNSGVVSDAQVYLTQAQGFKDEIFVSGGAYTFMTGTASSVTTFNTTGYPQLDPAQFPAGSLILSGGANVSGNLNDWISIVRSLNASASVYDLSGFTGITFKASGMNKVQVFIDMDGIQNFNYFTKTIDVAPTQQNFTLKFSDFSQRFGNQIPFDASKIKYIGFILDGTLNPGVTAFNFEVSDIAILNNLTGINNKDILPDKFSLNQNFPNPFNPSTIIRYALPSSEKVSIKIYDIIGREVKTLVNEEKNAGTYSVLWNGRNNEGITVSSGIYLYRIYAGNYIETKKMTLVK
jgi:uncharacterized repeat protein (TIGR01451 family)/TQXA domain-containing protein